MLVREMMNSHPDVHGRSADALMRCIEDCYSCAQVCASCADACLGETNVGELVQCIRLNLDCADICIATGSVATRRTGTNMDVAHNLVSTCADACRACAAECAKHVEMHEHCQICARACEACAQSCGEALPLFH
nr:four-helix bundle copper-binding protein [Ensifer sp. Root142]